MLIDYENSYSSEFCIVLCPYVLSFQSPTETNLSLTGFTVCVLPAYLPPLFLSTKQPMRTSRVSKATAHNIPTNHSWDPAACLLDTARTKEFFWGGNVIHEHNHTDADLKTLTNTVLLG